MKFCPQPFDTKSWNYRHRYECTRRLFRMSQLVGDFEDRTLVIILSFSENLQVCYRKGRLKVLGLVKIVDVPRFNTILGDHARRHYEPATRTLWALAPEMMARKIAAANVQQSFMLAAVLVLASGLPRSQLLCVGCYEDTAYEAIRQMAIPIRGIDPNVDGLELSTFVKENADLLNTFDLVFSTSVIEHVEDDVLFVRQIASLLKPGGLAVLTCDFLNSWRPGDRVPPSDVRFYRSTDLSERLLLAMPGCRLLDKPDWDEYGPDFDHAECRYSFATFTVIKEAK